MEKALKTYLVSLAIDDEGIEDGDRASMSDAALDAVVTFRQTLSKFIIENELSGEVTVVNEDTHIALVAVSTTKEIADRLRELPGVEAVVEGDTLMEMI